MAVLVALAGCAAPPAAPPPTGPAPNGRAEAAIAGAGVARDAAPPQRPFHLVTVPGPFLAPFRMMVVEESNAAALPPAGREPEVPEPPPAEPAPEPPRKPRVIEVPPPR